MGDVTPIEFIFFTALAYIPTGPYVWKETDWKGSGLALTALGFIGTISVGVAVFWRLLPPIFFEPRVPAIVPFLVVSLTFASIIAFLLLRRDGSAIASFRDIALACVALWLTVRFILPIASQQLERNKSDTSISTNVTAAVSTAMTVPKSDFDQLNTRLNAQNAQFQKMQAENAQLQARVQDLRPILKDEIADLEARKAEATDRLRAAANEVDNAKVAADRAQKADEENLIECLKVTPEEQQNRCRNPGTYTQSRNAAAMYRTAQYQQELAAGKLKDIEDKLVKARALLPTP